MTQVQIANLRSKQIAAEITNSSMSKSQKLQTMLQLGDQGLL
ncbi:MAG: hypothetical protein ACLU6Y_15555 [Ruminococcus sp.]